MGRGPGLLAVAVVLSGCAAPIQGTPPPDMAAPATCAPGAFTLADGRSVQRTCNAYRGCMTFAVDVPPGARSSALPFFVMPDGRPTSQYPGVGNCL